MILETGLVPLRDIKVPCGVSYMKINERDQKASNSLKNGISI